MKQIYKFITSVEKHLKPHTPKNFWIYFPIVLLSVGYLYGTATTSWISYNQSDAAIFRNPLIRAPINRGGSGRVVAVNLPSGWQNLLFG